KERLEYPVGKSLYETNRRISGVRLSRDGSRIAFFEHSGAGATLMCLGVAGREPRTLSKGWFVGSGGLAWSPDGNEIWLSAAPNREEATTMVHAVTVSGKLRDVMRVPGELRLLDIAPDGRALFAHWNTRLGVRALGPGAGSERELSWFDVGFLGDLSAD